MGLSKIFFILIIFLNPFANAHQISPQACEGLSHEPQTIYYNDELILGIPNESEIELTFNDDLSLTTDFSNDKHFVYPHEHFIERHEVVLLMNHQVSYDCYGAPTYCLRRLNYIHNKLMITKANIISDQDDVALKLKHLTCAIQTTKSFMRFIRKDIINTIKNK